MNAEQPRPESAHTPESRPAGAAPTDQNPHASHEWAPFRRIRDETSPQSINSAVLEGSHLEPGRSSARIAEVVSALRSAR